MRHVIFNRKYILSLLVLASLVSCTDSGLQPMVSPSGNSMPDDMQFTGTGIGDDFSTARQNAFAEVVKKGIIYVIGDSGYNAKKSQIDGAFLPYTKARYYVLGEVKKNTAKQKKWLSTGRTASGQMELKLQAYIDLKKLKEDLDGIGASTTTKKPNTVNNTTTTVNTVNTTSTVTTTTTPDTSDEDLSDVDLSALTFLVIYNLSDPVYKNDKNQAEYARWGISYINKELGKVNITTFDADTMEKLAEERNLLQEEANGSIGIGQLLANAIHAELYAEVTPSVSYKGIKVENAIMDVKIYVRTTGKLIDTYQVGGGEMYANDLTSNIKGSLKVASQKIMKKLIPTLKKYVKDGRVYFVRLNGVNSYKDASKFTSSVKTVDGVKNVSLKSGSKADGVYDFYVEFTGNPTDLMDRLFEFLPDQPGFENFDLQEVRGNELIFTLQ